MGATSFASCATCTRARFFQTQQPNLDGILRTEGSKAHAVVESYLGSPWSSASGSMCSRTARGRGNAEVAEATANTCALAVREQVEDATRLALIYP